MSGNGTGEPLSRVDERKGQFKKTLTTQDTRRKREDATSGIRKSKREEQLAKRRREFAGGKASAMQGAQVAVPDASELYVMVDGVKSMDPKLRLNATTQFRKLLSIERNPPIDQVIQVGVVPYFTNFLDEKDHPILQFEAAWALTNIASGTPMQTRVVIESGAVDKFVKLLLSTNDDVREQAVWALGNIAGDSPMCRDYVLSRNALEPLLENLGPVSKMSMLRNATWTLSNFCRGKPPPPFEQVRPALAKLSTLLFSADDEVLTDACWALSYLSDGEEDRIQEVLAAGIPQRMVVLLSHELPSVQTPALRTIGNIVTGTDPQTQAVLNYGALPALGALLQTPKKAIRKEACWTISNITAGPPHQIQAVLDANLIGPILDMLRGETFDIQKEAAWALSNATSGGTPEQIQFLVHQGCMEPLVNLLRVTDHRIVMVALEGLENILKAGAAHPVNGINPYIHWLDQAGGVTAIEQLQSHVQQAVYDRAAKIVQHYLSASQADEHLAPQTDDVGQFQFGAAQPVGQAFNFQNAFQQQP